MVRCFGFVNSNLEIYRCQYKCNISKDKRIIYNLLQSIDILGYYTYQRILETNKLFTKYYKKIYLLLYNC